MRNIITVIVAALVFQAFATSSASAKEVEISLHGHITRTTVSFDMQTGYVYAYSLYIYESSKTGIFEGEGTYDVDISYQPGSRYPRVAISLPFGGMDVDLEILGEDWNNSGQSFFRTSIKLEVGCTCGACCFHRCTCGNLTTPCTGTGGAGGCACHVGHGLCDACCACKCEGGTGPQPHEPCDGLPGSCECHADLCNCGACCIHYCTCGLKTTPCNGTTGDGGCSCHENDDLYCNCGACCECRCKVGKKHKKSCLGHCEHNCPEGCYVNEDYQQHCECHHEEGDGHDPNGDGDCCEHHKKNYVAPPDIGPGRSLSHPGEFKPTPVIDVDIDTTPVNPGPGGTPLAPEELKELPATDLENEDMPGLRPVPESGPGMSTEYLTGFENGLPNFDFEKVQNKIKDELEQAMPMEWIEAFEAPTGAEAGPIQWSVDCDAMFGGFAKGLGSYDFEFDINKWFDHEFAPYFRLVLLAMVVIAFIGNVRDLIWNA